MMMARMGFPACLPIQWRDNRWAPWGGICLVGTSQGGNCCSCCWLSIREMMSPGTRRSSRLFLLCTTSLRLLGCVDMWWLLFKCCLLLMKSPISECVLEWLPPGKIWTRVYDQVNTSLTSDARVSNLHVVCWLIFWGGMLSWAEGETSVVLRKMEEVLVGGRFYILPFGDRFSVFIWQSMIRVHQTVR